MAVSIPNVGASVRSSAASGVAAPASSGVVSGTVVSPTGLDLSESDFSSGTSASSRSGLSSNLVTGASAGPTSSDAASSANAAAYLNAFGVKDPTSLMGTTAAQTLANITAAMETNGGGGTLGLVVAPASSATAEGTMVTGMPGGGNFADVNAAINDGIDTTQPYALYISTTGSDGSLQYKSLGTVNGTFSDALQNQDDLNVMAASIYEQAFPAGPPQATSSSSSSATSTGTTSGTTSGSTGTTTATTTAPRVPVLNVNDPASVTAYLGYFGVTDPSILMGSDPAKTLSNITNALETKGGGGTLGLVVAPASSAIAEGTALTSMPSGGNFTDVNASLTANAIDTSQPYALYLSTSNANGGLQYLSLGTVDGNFSNSLQNQADLTQTTAAIYAMAFPNGVTTVASTSSGTDATSSAIASAATSASTLGALMNLSV